VQGRGKSQLLMIERVGHTYVTKIAGRQIIGSF